jgi:hypothetical protein
MPQGRRRRPRQNALRSLLDRWKHIFDIAHAMNSAPRSMQTAEKGAGLTYGSRRLTNAGHNSSKLLSPT